MNLCNHDASRMTASDDRSKGNVFPKLILRPLYYDFGSVCFKLCNGDVTRDITDAF